MYTCVVQHIVLTHLTVSIYSLVVCRRCVSFSEREWRTSLAVMRCVLRLYELLDAPIDHGKLRPMMHTSIGE
jgi:ubiquitin-protein ligase